MLIQLIVLTLAINTTIITFKNYYNILNYSKYQDPFDDAILNIERLLKTYMIESIDIRDDTNKIIINYRKVHDKAELKIKEISFENDKKRILLLTFDENNKRVGFNIIMLDVSEFDIIKKKNLYYLKITNSNNDERVICL